MISAVDLYALEKKAGADAVRKMRAGLRYAVARTLHQGDTGDALRSDSRAVFKDNRLQRITIRAPHYVFKNHFGFEGEKKNGVMMRLKQRDILNIALDQSGVLESLADELANIRADEVALRITFDRPENRKYISS